MKLETVDIEEILVPRTEKEWLDFARKDCVMIVYNCYLFLSGQAERLGKDSDYFGNFEHCWRMKPLEDYIQKHCGVDDRLLLCLQRGQQMLVRFVE